MRIFGLRAYILFNILIICAFAMFVIVLISTKITEQFAIQGRIEGTKSIITAFESTYYEMGRTKEGITFLESALEQGATGILINKHNKLEINTTKTIKKINYPEHLNDFQNIVDSKVSINGSSILPFTTYKSYEIIYPLRSKKKSDDAVIYILQPLRSFQDTIELSQKLATMSAFLFILIIGIFGYYLLSRTVVQPIEKLIDITKGISKGYFPQDTRIGNITEIQKLYGSLDNMYREIEEKAEILEKNIVELEEANINLKDTQKQLLATEKLASLGILSAGVAHEIGNPIYSISGYVEILKKDTTLDSEKKLDYLKKIESEIERITLIIKTLLDYAKPNEISITEENLNEVIDESIEILKNQGTFKKIKIATDLWSEPLILKMDKNQMIQVFINLILNAVDAIDADGLIEIKTYKPENNTIRVTIKDNGKGIPKEMIDKIFDPFYSTKDPGKGTGLGLSICQRIVEEFNGKITAKSEENLGTELEIIFTSVQN